MMTLTVKQERTGPVIGRHPWVFSHALKEIPDGLKPGEPVRLVDERNRFLAIGYFSSYSQIAVRLWGFDEKEVFDDRFFERRIDRAFLLRRRYLESPGTDSYRVVNGENDGLPGLIVDKYASYLVVQFHTKGIESWTGEIVKALEKILHPTGIYDRSDLAVRRYDDLGPREGVLSGTVPEIVSIKENGLIFLVDVVHGQKTGFFLDQRDKRMALTKYAADRNVLNCFSYTGAFGVYALAGGARSVVNVDSSARALDLARENVAVNGFDMSRCTFVDQEAKAYLRQRDRHFQVVVLDPPAFIKDRRKKKEGLVGYKSLNEAGLAVLEEDGVLLTASCSSHLSTEEFRFLLSEAAGKTGRTLRFIETFTHGIDHPQLVSFTEGTYLKCFIALT